MALFKILKGSSTNLSSQAIREGYCYVTTDEGKMYIDISDKERICLQTDNATHADKADTADKLSYKRLINGVEFDGSSDIYFYGTCSTAASTAAKTVTLQNGSTFVLKTGATVIVKFTNKNSVGSPTLNINGTGAKPIYRYGTTAASTSDGTSGWRAGSVHMFTYDGTGWIRHFWENTNTVPSGYCATGADTAAKTATCTDYALKTNSYLHLIIKYTNTATKALTLNINGKGAKPIYINGAASSTSNYTLPAGSYITFYDGTNYYIRTDGTLPGSIESATNAHYATTAGSAGTAGVANSVAWNNVTNKPSSYPPSNHTHDYIMYKDTRNDNQSPDDLQAGLTVHLKNNSTDGLTDGGTYHAVIGIKDWGDYSGGPYGQIATTKNENLWFRTSTSGTTWGNWKKIIHSDNIGSQSVSYATSAGAAGTAGSATNANHAITADSATKATQDGDGNTISSTYAKVKTWNNFVHNSNEFTFAAPAYGGTDGAYLWLNYRTASGKTDGNITGYKFGNGKGAITGVTVEAATFKGALDGNAKTATYATSAGTAGTANSATSATTATTATRISLNGIDDSTTYGTYGGIIQDSSTGPEEGSWHNSIKILHSNANKGWYTQLAQNFTGTEGLWHRSYRNGVQGSWHRVLDSNCYTSYTVKKDGTGATGTWGISISGNAASASTAGTAGKLLDTVSVGGSTTPVYFSKGSPVACGVYSKGTKAFSTVATVGSDGVMEIGRYIDFHYTNDSDNDYDVRIDSAGTGKNILYLPGVTGQVVVHTNDTAIGGSDTPVYIASTGAATAASTYAGGTQVKLNNVSKSASTAEFYAPTAAGTAGQVLKSAGSGKAPVWANISDLMDGRFVNASGDTMTGNLTLTGEKATIYKNERKKASGGGWAYAPMRFVGNDNAVFANIGAYGGDNALTYMYIGVGDYNSDVNLRISPTGAVTAKSFVGPLTGNATSATTATKDSSGAIIKNTYVKKAGDTMSGALNTSYQSSTWINSANGKSAINLTGTEYTGWISGNAKDGKLVISSYPSNNNLLYFGYMSNDRIAAGTNSLEQSMTWDGSTNTLTATTFKGALDGNAKTATNATNATNANYAASAGTAGSANTATTANQLAQNTRMDYGWNGLNYFNISGTAGNAAKKNDTPTSAWWHILRFNHANSSGYYTDLAVPFNANSLYYKRIASGTVQNSGWVKVLDALNYNSYAPKLDGTGAKGTWGISISGNAATATNANYAASAGTAGSAGVASKISDITETDKASSSDTKRRIWFAYSNNVTGRPAYDDRFTIQTSTGTLFAPIFSGTLSGAIKDYNDGKLVKFGYSTAGVAQADAVWLGVWDATVSGEYRLRAVKQADLRVAYATNANYATTAGSAGSANTATSATYLTSQGANKANTRTQASTQAVVAGGWSTDAAGYGSTYGTTLDVSGYSTWYHRLAFHTNGEIDYWQGINTNTLTKIGRLLTSANWTGIIDGHYVKKTGDSMSGTLSWGGNVSSLNLRTGHASYDGVISYQTSGNEAMLFTTKNAVTSFMFVNGEDTITNMAADRWTKVTPGLQIKNNCVAIGKLIANDVAPSYKLEVAGTLRVTGASTLSGAVIANRGTATGTSAYGDAAVEIREYNFGGAQSDTWGYAPRLSFHWAGLVAAQIGLASNGNLYIQNNTAGGGSFSPIMTEALADGRYVNVSGDTMTGHLYANNGFTFTNMNWTAPGNITCVKNSNGSEFSFDMGAGTQWHVWSTPKSASILSCWADSMQIDANGLLVVSTGNSHNGIKIGSTTYLNAISDQVIFQGNNGIRFGADNWDWNCWAGLKYVHASKTISLGLADGTTFNANSAQSGGTLALPGIRYFSINGKTAIDANDTWLRINEGRAFSSGIYMGTNIVRTDDQFQVGSGGANFYANSSGNGYFSNTLGIAGTNTGYKLYVNGNARFNGTVLGYNYANSHNAAAFIYDKPGSHYTGIGACDITNMIHLGPCDINGAWVGSYNQIWRFQGDISVGNQIYNTAYRGGMWISGRDNALIRTKYSTSSSSFAPVVSAKTQAGSWDLGPCNPYEDFYFSYASDANYNAGSNSTVTTVRITNAGKIYGAVWNDYAEYRSCTTTFEAGQVVCENGDDTLSLATERLQPGACIVSDTFGFAIGETDIADCPIAVSGRVLAYPYEPRESYKAGDPVCAGPGGTVSKMTREEVREYPDRMIGTVSAIPKYETWGQDNVPVNGRIWIKVV